MKVTYISNTFTIEEECGDQTQAFEFLANCKEVFGNTTCRKCGGEAQMQIRKPKGYTYYEMKCTNFGKCGYELKFGVSSEGGMHLYPKWQDKDKKPLPHGGWVEPYRKREQSTEHSDHGEF